MYHPGAATARQVGKRNCGFVLVWRPGGAGTPSGGACAPQKKERDGCVRPNGVVRPVLAMSEESLGRLEVRPLPHNWLPLCPLLQHVDQHVLCHCFEPADSCVRLSLGERPAFTSARPGCQGILDYKSRQWRRSCRPSRQRRGRATVSYHAPFGSLLHSFPLARSSTRVAWHTSRLCSWNPRQRAGNVEESELAAELLELDLADSGHSGADGRAGATGAEPGRVNTCLRSRPASSAVNVWVSPCHGRQCVAADLSAASTRSCALAHRRPRRRGSIELAMLDFDSPLEGMQAAALSTHCQPPASPSGRSTCPPSDHNHAAIYVVVPCH